MTNEIRKIYNAILDNEELCQIITEVPSITIVEYSFGIKESGCLAGSQAFVEVLNKLDRSADAIKTIYIFGEDAEAIDIAADIERIRFQEAKIIQMNHDWKSVSKDKPLAHEGTLILHFTTETGYSYNDFINTTKWKDFVNNSRNVYSAAIMKESTLFGENIRIWLQTSLKDFVLPSYNPETQTDYCKERQKTLNIYHETLSNGEAFRQIFQEVNNGCSECNLCRQYSSKHVCPLAQRHIAMLFREGALAPQSDKLAHQWEIKAAKQHYLPAMRQIAYDYEMGKGCELNQTKAIEMFRTCVNEFSDIESCEDIVRLYEDLYEDLSEKKPIQALPWIARLANAGKIKYAQLLADAYKDGNYGLLEDENQSDEWSATIDRLIENEENLRELLKNEDSLEIVNNLAGRYYWGSGDCKENKKWAYICYLRAAELGDWSAQEKVSEEYYHGNHLPNDDVRSLYWAEKAYAQGSRSSRFRIAYLCSGSGRGVIANYERSFKLYSELVEEGNAAAMNNLGCMYGAGDFITKDYHKAFELYLRSATLGDEVAMRNVAFYYKDGTAGEQNYELALQWFKKAAEKGDVRAMKQVALFYKDGLGVEVSADNTCYWYQKAIDKGDEDAMLELGLLYELGEIIDKDEEKAVSYYRKAAEKGNARAQHFLGNMYIWGRGVSYDKNMAIFWYRKAAGKGYSAAIEKLKELNEYWINEKGKFEI